MRILHFSDIHIGTRLRAVPMKRWLGKRAVGAANLLAGRYRRFQFLRFQRQRFTVRRDDDPNVSARGQTPE